MWFVRVGTKVTGPFSEAQLRSMRQRGEFSPIHQVSTDRIYWESAASLVQMLDGPLPQWPKQPKPAAKTAAGVQPAAPPPLAGHSFTGPAAPPVVGHSSNAAPANWYYVDSQRRQIGPVPEDALRELLASGKVSRRAMVCRQGDTAWEAARARPEFAASPSSGARRTWIVAGIAAIALVAVGLTVFATLRSRSHVQAVADLPAKETAADGDSSSKAPGGAKLPNPADAKNGGNVPNGAAPPVADPPKPAPDKPAPDKTEAAAAAADGGPNAMTPVEQMISRALPSVALIKGSAGSGSGFLVSSKLLVTNRHVIETELTESLKIYFPSAKEGERGPYVGSVVYEHEERDLAFISLNTNLPFLKTAPPSSFRPGGKVVVIGNPGSRVADATTGGVQVVVNAVTHGYMSAEVGVAGKKFYHFDITVNHGNSGGPALDSNGEVIAVVDIGEAAADRLNYFIPAFEVSAATERLQRLTEKEIALNQAKHQAKAFFVSINKASLRRLMLVALRLQKQIDLKDVATDRELQILDFCFLELLHPHLSGVLADPNVSPAIREKLQAYANNYGELKIAQESLAKRVSNATILKLEQLANNFKAQTEALTALLGPPIDVQLNEKN